MTPHEHYVEAERLAKEASREEAPEWYAARAALAQVHATLSLQGIDADTWNTDIGKLS